MPTHTPKKGLPRSRTASVMASTMPGTGMEAARQSAKAPTPGSTMRSALATASGSEVTAMVSSSPASRAARSNALAAECRLPGAVIDDRDAHRLRSASGKKPITGSGLR
jgi:hypothetical protein